MLDKLPPFRAIDTQHVKVILDQFDTLFSYEVEVPVDKVSRLAIAAKCYTWVITAWERKYTDEGLKREGVGAQSYWVAKAALTDDYSERVMCLKLSGLDDWKQRVVLEFRHNEEHFPLGKEARFVVAEAGMESDSVSLVRKSAACLLSSATTIDRGETWVGRAFNKEGMVPFSRVCAYAMLRTHLHINFDKNGYIKYNGTPKARLLFSVLEKILLVYGDVFWDKLKTARDGTFDVAKGVVSSELHNPWISYLAIAMGAVLEERQYFVDCLKYYEWVIKNSANPDLKTLMRMRWIKNKDRHLDRREQQEKLNGPVDSASKRKTAMEIALERSTLKRTMDSNNITSIDIIPDSFNIDWEQFFEEVFREIPADVDLSSQSDNGNESEGNGNETEEEQGSSNGSESTVQEDLGNESSDGVIPIDDDTLESKDSPEVEEKQSGTEEVNVDDEESMESDVESSSTDTQVASDIDNDNDLLNEEGEEMANEKQRNDAYENQLDNLPVSESPEMVGRIQLFHAYIVKRFGLQVEQLPKIAISFKGDTGLNLTDYLGCKIAVCKKLPSFNKLLRYTTVGQRNFLQPLVNTVINKSCADICLMIKNKIPPPPKLERWEQNFARNDELCFIGTINIIITRVS